MDAKRLAEIKARADAATKGPWYRVGSFSVDACVESEATTGGLPTMTACVDGDGRDAEARDDADFIAHARQDVPDLLAEVERLQGREKALEHHASALEAMTQDYMRRYGVL